MGNPHVFQQKSVALDAGFGTSNANQCYFLRKLEATLELTFYFNLFVSLYDISNFYIVEILNI
ncbi:hypothetical protein GCM10011386_44780 [Parapedobacter defluvii]|uniref:Uncharacterized protein n=1 Tax=Parapedobacter defluvii TaxID=2045106 RepID=A0ABQ1MVL7_9SPHI|nr:hypothetical protein GCM10011386_44780 [Parapedobacter defluvii]